MATLISWYSELLPFAAGLPVTAVNTAVRDACVEFCQRTHLWRLALDRISVVADTQDYVLTIPSAQYGEIEIIDQVYFKITDADDTQFKELDPISEEQMNNHDSWDAWRFRTGPTPTEFWVDNIDKTLHLLPIPDTAATLGLLVYVILKPTDVAPTVPDFLYRDWKDAITAGALKYLLGNKNTPWYDITESLRAGDTFATKMGAALHKKISGGTKRPSRIQLPFFA